MAVFQPVCSIYQIEFADDAVVRFAKSTSRRRTANENRWHVAFRSFRFGCEGILTLLFCDRRRLLSATMSDLIAPLTTPCFGWCGLCVGMHSVFDEMRYPQYYLGSGRDYHPKLFIDEFWMSDDQLIKLNDTGECRQMLPTQPRACMIQRNPLLMLPSLTPRVYDLLLLNFSHRGSCVL